MTLIAPPRGFEKDFGKTRSESECSSAGSDASLLVEPADDESGLTQVVERLDSVLPQRARMFGPFLSALEHAEDGAYLDWPRLVAEIALVLQSEARPHEARFLRVLGTCETRLFRVAFEARDPVLARDCLVEALRLINTARTAPPERIPELLEQLVDRAVEANPGPLALRWCARGRASLELSRVPLRGQDFSWDRLPACQGFELPAFPRRTDRLEAYPTIF